MEIPKEKLLWMYQTMVLSRNFEDRLAKEFARGVVPGFVHLSQGQEAIAAGAVGALRKDDYLCGTHRSHAQCIAKGESTKKIMAELFAKKTGSCKGKGGSMHISNPELGMLGTNGIVGAGINIIGGAALSAKKRGTDQVGMVIFGDGACQTSAFHEGINLASIWNLPVIYVIENNGLAETTKISYSAKIANIADRAAAYGIPGVTIDGNDPTAVYEAVQRAIDRARKGDGPTIVECKTLRGAGMYEGDTQTYRTEEDWKDIREKDPIPRFEQKLIEMGILTEKESQKIRKEAAEEIDAAVKFAEESPSPDPEDCLKDVFF
jgi:TPP-dependent pyruvate/acetoin dehydrogenase alpha subunit